VSDQNDQSQKVGANAIAIQATGNVTISTGVNAAEARQIAVDVFRSEFMTLSGTARPIAEERAENIREQFFEKLQHENPNGLSQAADVDFQHGLFAMQRDYARTGDADLGSLLVDLLVDRSKEVERNLKQIVLNEALATAPKLTQAQIAALGLIFLFRHTQNSMVVRPQRFGDYLDKYAQPLVEALVLKDSSFQHLEFAGCGAISLAVAELGTIFQTIYRGIFTNGFEPEELDRRSFPSGNLRSFFMECFRDAKHLQVTANNKEVLEEMLKDKEVPDVEAKVISDLFNIGPMPIDQIQADVIAQRPYMTRIFETWSKTSMKNFTLTTVGMAIGHASVKRHTGEFSDLSVWIN
jgi:hypothetical protein